MPKQRWSWALYAGLVLLRLFFALQPSYIHPDELFQGADALTADLFGSGRSSTLAWEFTSQYPIRAIAPLYLFLSPALYVLRALKSTATPQDIFTTLRLQQFGFSLCIDALVYLLSNARRSRQRKTLANLLSFASSYTAWTYHTHTFSNSWETLLVLLALYLHLYQHGYVAQLSRGVILALGAFTRISFLSFLAPIYFLSLGQRAALASVGISLSSAFATAILLIFADSAYYQNTAALQLPIAMTKSFGAANLPASLSKLVLTPVNNLLYNADGANLAQHGLHPRWTHIINLAVLLGPLLFLLPGRLPKRSATLIVSAVSGFVSLSLVPHQEARFLLPVTALLLTAIDLDAQEEVIAEEVVVLEAETVLEKEFIVANTKIVASIGRLSRKFITAWILFNTLAGSLFGLLHQRGVISASLDIARMQQNATLTALDSPSMTASSAAATNVSAAPFEGTPIANKPKTLVAASDIQVAYYKTYPAPAYLLPPGVDIKHLRGCSERCTNPGAALNKDSLETTSFLIIPLAFLEGNGGNMTDARRTTAKFLQSTFVEVGRYTHVDLDNLDLTVQPAWQHYRDSLRAWWNGVRERPSSGQVEQEQSLVKAEAMRARQASTPVAPAQKITADVSTPSPAPPQAATPVPEVSMTPGPRETVMARVGWPNWLFRREDATDAPRSSNSLSEKAAPWPAPMRLTGSLVRDASEAQRLVLLKRRHPVKIVRSGDADVPGAVRRRVPDTDWRMM